MLTAPEKVRTLALIGAGVVGAGWAAYFLARGYAVRVFDPAAAARDAVAKQVAAVWPTLHRLGWAKTDAPPTADIFDNLSEACRGAEFVQESGPESVPAKLALMAEIDAATLPDVVIASSSSSLLTSDYQTSARHPERIIAAHPFNPASLVPLVEIAGGRLTAAAALDWAMAFFRAAGKRPIRVRREVSGYVANRMAAALYREAVHLVASGVATVEDVDTAIANGPGLRWALMGPHLVYHLGGGQGGYRHYLDHLGAGQEARWRSLETAPLTPELKEKLIAGVAREISHLTPDQLAELRDRGLADILMAVENAGAALDRRDEKPG